MCGWVGNLKILHILITCKENSEILDQIEIKQPLLIRTIGNLK